MPHVATLARCLLIPAVLALTVSTGSAQEQQPERRGPQGGRFGGQFGGGFGGGQFGGTNKATLLRAEQVQKELKLTDEQKSKVETILEESRGPRRPEGGNREDFRNLSQEERTKRFQEMAEQRRKQTQELEQKIEGALDVDQVKRLNEIAIQQQGLAALNDPDVAAELKISDEQKTKIREANEANREKMRELFTAGRGEGQNGEDRRAKFQELRTSTEKQIMDVLTAEQKQAFEDMKGSPFELDRRALFQGGRRGGEGGRRPGGERRPSENQE